MSRCVVAGIKRACGQRPAPRHSFVSVRPHRRNPVHQRPSLVICSPQSASCASPKHNYIQLCKEVVDATTGAGLRWKADHWRRRHTLGGKHAKTGCLPPNRGRGVLVGCRGFHGSLPDV